MQQKPYFLVFSNDSAEFYVPVCYIWTEDRLNDLHVQFNGPGDCNYWPKLDTDGMFEVKYRGKIYKAKKLSIETAEQLRTYKDIRRLSVKVLQKFWHSPNRF